MTRTKTRTISKNKKEKVLEKTNGHCAYCGKRLDIRGMTIDHVVPLAHWEDLGTPDASVNNIDNLLPCCCYCNRVKRQMTLNSFRTEIERSLYRLRKSSSDFKLATRFGLIKVSSEPVKFYFEMMEAENA